MKPIPYGRQNITQADIDAVIEVLKGDFLTQGPEIERFEKNFADYIGCKYAVAVSNGTAALHLSSLALNVQPGDKIITTPITFAASANCIKYCGGEVIFADIDPESYCLDVNKVRDLIERFPKGTIKGIIPVDFAGYPVNMEEFRELANEYGLWILEDACHAPGGFYFNKEGKKQECGNGNYADLTVFSFHPVKHIAAGEGGMITTNNDRLYRKLLMLRTHGIIKDSSLFQNSLEVALGDFPIKDLERSDIPREYPGWYYEMQELGFNYRLTDFQAALGNSQLKRANEGLKRRRDIAQRYYDFFREKLYIKGQSGIVNGHAYHLYVIEVEKRKELYDFLRSRNILVQIHYVPLHLMPYYKQFGWKEGDLPVAEQYYKHCISLPMYPALTEKEQEFVIKSINDFFTS